MIGAPARGARLMFSLVFTRRYSMAHRLIADAYSDGTAP
jgi:hypothetical protein